MTYRLCITEHDGDNFPGWWPNYLTENHLWSSGTKQMQRHLQLNHRCQYIHITHSYERWLEFQSESDAVLFLLRYA